MRPGILALLVTLACHGCGPRFDGSVLHKRQVDYRVAQLGGGFARIEVGDNDLAFYQAELGTISVNATCRAYDDVPAAALLNHLLFGMTERVYVRDEELTVDGRGARHAVVDAELDGVPIRVEIYLLTRAGCVFDLSYISDRAARAHDDFARFVQGFHIQAVRP